MKKGYYLLSYKVNGIKNIDKDIKLEFYKKTLDKEFDPSQYNVKAIYGENGTGKSGIIWSVRILKNLMINKYYLNDSNNIYVLKDLINKKTKELAIEIEFLNNIVNSNKESKIYAYKYSICINYDQKIERFFIKHEQLDEIFIGKKNNKNIFEINEGVVSKSLDNKLFNKLNAGNGIDSLKEHSFISDFLSKNYNYYFKEDPFKYTEKEAELIYALFMCVAFASNLYIYQDYDDTYEDYKLDNLLSTFLNSVNHNQELPIINSNTIADATISYKTYVSKNNFEAYEKDVDKIYEFIKIFKPELKNIEIEKIENKDKYECTLIFVYDDYKVNSVFESNGVRKLIRLFKAIDSIDKGSIVFIDEMDSNIHDVYLCRLIEYIKEYAKGQLCFTTQSITVMDVLEDRKKSLDFISRDHEITSWFKNSHYSASKKYKEGYIEKSPFNIEPFDFLKAFGATLDEE